MATLIVGSQEELDGIMNIDGTINEDKVDVILFRTAHEVIVKKGPFTEEERR
jgi:hypothetical protein